MLGVFQTIHQWLPRILRSSHKGVIEHVFACTSMSRWLCSLSDLYSPVSSLTGIDMATYCTEHCAQALPYPQFSLGGAMPASTKPRICLTTHVANEMKSHTWALLVHIWTRQVGRQCDASPQQETCQYLLSIRCIGQATSPCAMPHTCEAVSAVNESLLGIGHACWASMQSRRYGLPQQREVS